MGEIFELPPVWSRTVTSVTVLVVILVARFVGARIIGDRVADPDRQFRGQPWKLTL